MRRRHDLSSGLAHSTILFMTAQTGVNALVEEVLPQGGWGDGDYLWVTDHARQLVEFTDHGVFERRAHAWSGILDGFGVAVDDVLRAGKLR